MGLGPQMSGGSETEKIAEKTNNNALFAMTTMRFISLLPI
jgi:hypothetical protein